MILLRYILTLVVLASGASGADVVLHSILIDVPVNNLWLVREEMALTAPPVIGRKSVIFSTNGKSREVIYQGSASLGDDPQACLGTGGDGKNPASRGKNDKGVTIMVEMTGQLPDAVVNYDVAMLLGSVGGQTVRYETDGQRVPANVNRWQEVASWTHAFSTVMLWQYVSAPLLEKADATPGSGKKQDWMLDVVIGTLPPQAAARACAFDSKDARACVEFLYWTTYAPWKYHGLHCQQGRPFVSRSSGGLQKKAGEASEEPSTVEGSLSEAGSGKHRMVGRWKAPGDHETALRDYPIDVELIAGEWKVLILEDGPRVLWPSLLLADWGAVFPAGFKKVNAICIRLRDPVMESKRR